MPALKCVLCNLDLNPKGPTNDMCHTPCDVVWKTSVNEIHAYFTNGLFSFENGMQRGIVKAFEDVGANAFVEFSLFYKWFVQMFDRATNGGQNRVLFINNTNKKKRKIKDPNVRVFYVASVAMYIMHCKARGWNIQIDKKHIAILMKMELNATDGKIAPDNSTKEAIRTILRVSCR